MLFSDKSYKTIRQLFNGGGRSQWVTATRKLAEKCIFFYKTFDFPLTFGRSRTNTSWPGFGKSFILVLFAFSLCVMRRGRLHALLPFRPCREPCELCAQFALGYCYFFIFTLNGAVAPFLPIWKMPLIYRLLPLLHGVFRMRPTLGLTMLFRSIGRAWTEANFHLKFRPCG